MVTCFPEPKLRSRQTSRTRNAPHKKENSAQRAQNRITALTEDNYQPSAAFGEERGLTFTFACLLSMCPLGLFSPPAIRAKGWHFPTGSRTQQVRSSLDVHTHGHVLFRHSVFTAPPGAILSTTQVGIRVDSGHTDPKKREDLVKL